MPIAPVVTPPMMIFFILLCFVVKCFLDLYEIFVGIVWRKLKKKKIRFFARGYIEREDFEIK